MGYTTYYWREVGGILFLGQRYRAAVTAYSRALTLEEHRLTKLLHADALMFSGEYKRAEEEFAQLLEAPIDTDDFEWELKRMALTWIRQEVGIDSQRRGRARYPEEFPNGLQASEIVESCRAALKTDALDGLAWFNLGASFQQSGRQQEAAMSFLIAALACPGDLEAWCNVIAYGMNENHLVLVCLSACTAYRFNGEEFLRDLGKRVPNRQDEFVNLMSEMVVEMKKTEESMTLRTHGGSGRWTETKIPPAG